MGNRIKVHLCGGEGIGWALDTDIALTRKSLHMLDQQLELTTLAKADVIHSVWEEPLFALSQDELEGKRIICHACNDLLRLYENPLMIRARDTIGLWIAMSRAAVNDFKYLRIPCVHIPYSVDTDAFFPDDSAGTDKKLIRRHYNISPQSFVISNFMRDSFGHDLSQPKDQKGAEMLVEIVRILSVREVPVHLLLAGPRRHWIRSQLSRLNLRYTYVGKEVPGDDLRHNILSADHISSLYRASDLHLITSRWEGGPRSVLEAVSCRIPILSTPVGTAPDILEAESLFTAFDEAVEKVELHWKERFLDGVIDLQQKSLQQRHTVEYTAELFHKLYTDIDSVKPFKKVSRWVAQPARRPSILAKAVNFTRRVTGQSSGEESFCVSLWHEFHKPPYGGGNQFMMALKKEMERQGIQVVVNKLSQSVDVHICNSCWFDYRKFERRLGDFPIRMIHRIDGPVTLYRGEGRSVDEKIFDLNKRFASATVFQSAYCFKKSYELGFEAVSPIVIHNSVNSAIFNEQKRSSRDHGRKIKLITSAWSDNPRKGGPLLKWLDDHLDWERFEYTFVGRVKESFNNIRHIPAVPSEELADLLRGHDIYIAVSRHEPCSNALLEALNCGLPAIYRDDGGNPELVSFGGLPFAGENDVLEQLDRATDNLHSFKRLIYVRSIENITKRYIALAKRLSAWS
jgi:glycosyltransferase involved in cell wall biosynthesis